MALHALFVRFVLISAAWIGIVIGLTVYWLRDNLEPENPPSRATLPVRRPRR